MATTATRKPQHQQVLATAGRLSIRNALFPQMEYAMAPLPDGPLLYVACRSWSKEGQQYLDVEEGDLLGIFQWLKGRTYFFAISLKTNHHGWLPTDVAVPMRLPNVEFVAK